MVTVAKKNENNILCQTKEKLNDLQKLSKIGLPYICVLDITGAIQEYLIPKETSTEFRV